MDKVSDNVTEQEILSAEGECLESSTYQPPPGVSYRDPTPLVELSSMMSDMYIDKAGDGSEEDESPVPSLKRPKEGNLMQLQDEVVKLHSSIQTMQTEIQTLKKDHAAGVKSAINREASFREAMDQRIESLEDGLCKSLAHLEAEMVKCLKRRDEHWKNEIAQLRGTSTPISPCPFGHGLSDLSHHPLSTTPLPPKPPINRVSNFW